ncbi:MAG: rRNA methyltransferase [Cytophagales bacterium]|nr:rRNA methyltransferase [Cytophagales bacterium]
MSQNSTLPSKFISRIATQLPDYDMLIAALDDVPTVAVRTNSLKTDLTGNIHKNVPWCSTGYYLHVRPIFTIDPLFHAGAYYVQEASSQFLDYILRNILPQNPLKVLDLCASPGGKSTLAVSILPQRSLLVANDAIHTRIPALCDNLSRWGYANYMVTCNDASDFAQLGEYFDVILVDAPCSGEGMFRKIVHSRSEWSVEHVQHCSMRQKRIVSDVLPCLKQGGYLIYSTCTFAPQENEDNVQHFTTELPLQNITSGIEVPDEWKITKSEFGFHFYPHRLQGEGFFISILQKCDEYHSLHKSSNKKRHYAEVYKDKGNIIKPYLKNYDDYSFFYMNEYIHTIDNSYTEDLQYLLSRVNVRYAGVCVGKIAHNEPVPSHDLALCLQINENLPCVETDIDNAIKFLKKGSINFDKQYPNGWYLVRYQGLNLGWIKVIGNRYNNYYPNELRILKDF